jgi:Uma2 family endonuclease
VTNPPPFTRADWERLPERFPAELVHGSLVKDPSPTFGHQFLAADIRDLLLRRVGRRRVVLGPIDVAVGEHDVYQPDVAVYDRDPPLDGRGAPLPIVVFEVLSSSTRRRDAGVKRKEYLRAGVQEVWLVDPDSKGIEVHTRAGVDTALGDQRVTSAAVGGFSLSPSGLFGSSTAEDG